jgi:redox-sensitive bicupin YhaK (pirin superfamily)
MAPYLQEREPNYDHKYFPFSERHGTLRLIASPEPSEESLRLQQDARVFSSILDRGHHVAYELSPGRGAWLHVVAGRVRLLDHCLEAGDGVCVDGEAAVSFTAQEASEILLFDLA